MYAIVLFHFNIHDTDKICCLSSFSVIKNASTINRIENVSVT